MYRKGAPDNHYIIGCFALGCINTAMERIPSVIFWNIYRNPPATICHQEDGAAANGRMRRWMRVAPTWFPTLNQKFVFLTTETPSSGCNSGARVSIHVVPYSQPCPIAFVIIRNFRPFLLHSLFTHTLYTTYYTAFIKPSSPSSSVIDIGI